MKVEYKSYDQLKELLDTWDRECENETPEEWITRKCKENNVDYDLLSIDDCIDSECEKVAKRYKSNPKYVAEVRSAMEYFIIPEYNSMFEAVLMVDLDEENEEKPL